MTADEYRRESTRRVMALKDKLEELGFAADAVSSEHGRVPYLQCPDRVRIQHYRITNVWKISWLMSNGQKEMAYRAVTLGAEANVLDFMSIPSYRKGVINISCDPVSTTWPWD